VKYLLIILIVVVINDDMTNEELFDLIQDQKRIEESNNE